MQDNNPPLLQVSYLWNFRRRFVRYYWYGRPPLASTIIVRIFVWCAFAKFDVAGWRRPSNSSCWLFSGTAMCLWFTTCLPCLVRCWSSCFWWAFFSSSWDCAARRKPLAQYGERLFFFCQKQTVWEKWQNVGAMMPNLRHAKFRVIFEQIFFGCPLRLPALVKRNLFYAIVVSTLSDAKIEEDAKQKKWLSWNRKVPAMLH